MKDDAHRYVYALWVLQRWVVEDGVYVVPD